MQMCYPRKPFQKHDLLLAALATSFMTLSA
jgi:hypothetical protein